VTSRAVRYAAAGVLATIIYVATVSALVEVAGTPPVAAAVIATILVIGTSYVVNRRFVFDTNRSHASALTRFTVASLVGIGCNVGLMYLATHTFKWPYLAGALLSTVVVPPLNFAVNLLWTFRAANDAP